MGSPCMLCSVSEASIPSSIHTLFLLQRQEITSFAEFQKKMDCSECSCWCLGLLLVQQLLCLKVAWLEKVYSLLKEEKQAKRLHICMYKCYWVLHWLWIVISGWMKLDCGRKFQREHMKARLFHARKENWRDFFPQLKTLIRLEVWTGGTQFSKREKRVFWQGTHKCKRKQRLKNCNFGVRWVWS